MQTIFFLSSLATFVAGEANCNNQFYCQPREYEGGEQCVFDGQLWTAQWWIATSPVPGNPAWLSSGACAVLPPVPKCTWATWSPSKQYNGGERVSYNNALWMARNWCPIGEPPAINTWWKKYSDCNMSELKTTTSAAVSLRSTPTIEHKTSNQISLNSQTPAGTGHIGTTLPTQTTTPIHTTTTTPWTRLECTCPTIPYCDELSSTQDITPQETETKVSITPAGTGGETKPWPAHCTCPTYTPQYCD
eukprot:Gregarina_sp_Poly_1__2670@NODE_1730_length_3447_cov_648_274260_g1131_i0_p1_GENE_NODE_1730_length_3447_cov_648_274260_g1131_i0NODE_1730_length_3447_cov_648_274260_g1131_i0_p1_ORF_typecomplete_len247_score13_46CBM_5_12_2/PF14600_6/0_003CBM_5_12_2/PF14600_6/0_034CBM_5_12/PF02839_14/0_12CBM_5_12/PF02839_14/5_9e03CBM_5_12/PF02839_14/1_2e04CBM_5_12/PF02839_14/8_7e02_NODE_1730_length_3447_cov_648_274260_g1131_i025353275